MKQAKSLSRKRPYLLFEVMISIALLSLCLIPLIRPCIGIARWEWNAIRDFQLQQLDQNTFCEIKILLTEKHFSWKELETKKINKELPPVSVWTGKKMKSCSRVCEISKLTASNKKKLYRKALLLKICIHFPEFNYSSSRTLFIECHENQPNLYAQRT